MAKTLLAITLLFFISIIYSCRSFYNTISNHIQTGLSIVFDTCNFVIIDSISNTILNRQEDSIFVNKRNAVYHFHCNTPADTIKLTQIDEKVHLLYIRRTSFNSLNYKIETFSNYRLTHNSDTNMQVKINSIIAFKSSMPLKNRNDTTGYKMENIVYMHGNKKNN